MANKKTDSAAAAAKTTAAKKAPAKKAAAKKAPAKKNVAKKAAATATPKLISDKADIIVKQKAEIKELKAQVKALEKKIARVKAVFD